MKMQGYQQLNPLAMAVAAACAEVIAVLLFALPMLGMMGGYGSMMGGYGHMGSFGFGFGIVWLLAGAVLAALLGAIFAWIYNAVAVMR